MARPTKTTSGRWEVEGDPAKWEYERPGAKWRSKRTGKPSQAKIEKWIEDMEEWSEMMYEAVMELRGQNAALRQEFRELSELVASDKPAGGDR